jgi:hypothetical protein
MLSGRLAQVRGRMARPEGGRRRPPRAGLAAVTPAKDVPADVRRAPRRLRFSSVSPAASAGERVSAARARPGGADASVALVGADASAVLVEVAAEAVPGVPGAGPGLLVDGAVGA